MIRKKWKLYLDKALWDKPLKYSIEWAFTWPSTTGHEVKSGLHSQWESENLILTKFRNDDLLLCSHVFLTSSTGQRHTVRSDF